MHRSIFILTGFALLVGQLPAAEFVAHKDVPYAQPKQERQTLDVYSPSEGRNCPVAIWIHGGGWSAGNKKDVFDKPQAFTSRGYVLVSINYRLQPAVTIEEIAPDVAKAVRWVHDHARDYDGDPQHIIVLGHSAGGQLAALIATDESYLKAEGLSLANLKACVPVDGRYWMGRGREKLSPAEHVAQGKGIPPFLVMHSAKTPDEAQKFVKLLQEAGVGARALAAEGKDHTTINEHLGKSGEAITAGLFEFLADVRGEEFTLDQRLIVACHRLDVDGVVTALRAGADANGRFGNGDFQTFLDPWTLGAPIFVKKWTPLFAVANASNFPPPPRAVEPTEADWFWAHAEQDKIPPEPIKARMAAGVTIAQILISHGAKIDAVDDRGATALYAAAENFKLDLAKLLLRYDANPDTKTGVYIDGPGGTTPLHEAQWSPELTKLLLEKGADPNAKASNGETAAQWPASKREPAVQRIYQTTPRK